MSHHTSSRQRKSDNKCVITRKQPKNRNCSILSSSNTLVCLHSNTVALVSLTPLHIGLPDQTTLLTTDRHHRNYLPVDLAATTTIKRPVAVVVHLVQTGTLLAETKPVVIIITRAVEVTAADRILPKVVVHRMALVLEDLAVGMVLLHLTTHKVVVVSTVALEEVRTQWVLLETNNMDGNPKERAQRLSCCDSSNERDTKNLSCCIITLSLCMFRYCYTTKAYL